LPAIGDPATLSPRYHTGARLCRGPGAALQQPLAPVRPARAVNGTNRRRLPRPPPRSAGANRAMTCSTSDLSAGVNLAARAALWRRPSARPPSSSRTASWSRAEIGIGRFVDHTRDDRPALGDLARFARSGRHPGDHRRRSRYAGGSAGLQADVNGRRRGRPAGSLPCSTDLIPCSPHVSP